MTKSEHLAHKELLRHFRYYRTLWGNRAKNYYYSSSDVDHLEMRRNLHEKFQKLVDETEKECYGKV